MWKPIPLGIFWTNWKEKNRRTFERVWWSYLEAEYLLLKILFLLSPSGSVFYFYFLFAWDGLCWWYGDYLVSVCFWFVFKSTTCINCLHKLCLLLCIWVAPLFVWLFKYSFLLFAYKKMVYEIDLVGLWQVLCLSNV